MSEQLIVNVTDLGVASITLNRPEKGNAFSSKTIQALIGALHSIQENPSVRCLVLRGKGKHFSAGADLNWMKSMAKCSYKDNLADAEQLALLMSTLDELPIPTIAAVQGCAFGGALGLICCCDIVVAEPSSIACFSEVKLGLVPATIAPYAIRAIGARAARRYMLSAEKISAQTSLELGLYHQICDINEQEQVLVQLINSVLANSPNAIRDTKALIRQCTTAIDPSLIHQTATVIANARVSVQGQHGLNAFFDKVPPDWSATVDEP
ncbi:enoyl-CoA hydratase-related protein [Vibrio maritimus]|jgi:methylglutaconyl-CoA hydratase